MAYPTILMNSTSGSDSNASGAGPTTAITSTSASTSSDGLTVTIPNADLTDVVTDGSHAVYISGEGLRSITGKADSGLSTANVTVGTAFTVSLTGQTAAIGGVRQYLFGSTKSEIESSCEAGWTISLAAGYTENLTAVTSLSFVDTSDNPITITGDENNRAKFISIHGAFAYSFDFSSSHGLRVFNIDFEHYRGSDSSGNGEGHYIVYCPARSYWKNCSVLVRRQYHGMAMFYTRYNTLVTFVNCEAKVTEDSAYKYTRSVGFSGRAYSCINCKTRYTLTAFNAQAFSAYQVLIAFCQMDTATGIYVGGNGYDIGGSFVGNIMKIQSGGAAFSRNGPYNYHTTSNYHMINNVVTSDGSYDAFKIYTPKSPERYKKIILSYNCFGGSGAIDSDLDGVLQVENITDDPQLTGVVGSFAIGNKAVLDHVSISPLVSPVFSSSTTGTQIYPFRQFVSDKFGAVLHPLRSN